jgi:hypothetical protein
VKVAQQLGIIQAFAAAMSFVSAHTLSGSEPSLLVRSWGSSGLAPTFLASMVLCQSLTR